MQVLRVLHWLILINDAASPFISIHVQAGGLVEHCTGSAQRGKQFETKLHSLPASDEKDFL